MSTSVTSSHQAEVTVDTATIEVITGIAAGVVSPDAPARAHVVWSEADTGLWAANYGGYYGGVVDQQGAHFFVSDTYGSTSGTSGPCTKPRTVWRSGSTSCCRTCGGRSTELIRMQRRRAGTPSGVPALRRC